MFSSLSSRQNPHHLFAVMALVLLLSWPTSAAESHYVIPDSLPATLLVPPPAEGTPAWQRDMHAVEEMQKHASSVDKRLMVEEQHVHVDQMARVMGDGFTREKLPHTFALLDRVVTDTSMVVDADKKFWHTRRPYLADKQVTLLIDPIDKSPAYPSGHTCISRVMAEVLGMLYPSRVTMLRAWADAVATHRIQAGVHSPSDIEGGRSLAMLVVGALSQSKDFAADLAAAKKETAGE